ncbi:MAG: electron transport complex subunit RsxC [Firmicutes bacterium]|jgi:electron transport complex protein RnfC|nr:electron transport complex subunit RsxC [Bacillota bacterium]
MSLKTFFGGIHPKYAKELTAESPVEILSAPETVVVPMLQHIGAPAVPTVKKGDEVLAGQVIGEATQPVSAPVHSPVSGKVVAVTDRPHVNGRSVLSVVIENDGENKWVELEPHPDPVQLDRSVILDKIRAAGIVGMGGAGFPTAVKLRPPKDAAIDVLLINGSECEPYLTSDHRLMLESAADVILGAKLLAKACGAKKIVIGVEDNKRDAVAELKKHAGAIEIVLLDTKYPQGGEKQLIKAVTGREVPSNGLPFQAGVVVQNVATAAAVAQAVRDGKPLVERIVTVTGSVINEPRNFLVPIGTPLHNLIEAAGGFTEEPGKVLVGGPMMGMAQHSLDAPVVKTVNGILALSKGEAVVPEPLPCIKCARCVDVCPVYLLPLRLEAFGMHEMWDEAKEYGAMDCIECGCCTYICPSKRPLLHYIRVAKNQIVAMSRKQGN